MKYIDADKLREKIEFAKSVYSNPRRVVHGVADAFMQDGRAAMCDDILKKLDSLQQDHLPDAGKMVESEHIADVSKMMEQTSLPSNLDEAARMYRNYREECGIKDPVMLNEIEEAHYAGAEWMSEQGESFETEIINVGVLSLPELKIQAGDRVIVQIRKKYETD